jgi:hypothetical protein
MTTIPASLRRLVIQRAENRCEYCRISQIGQVATFHRDENAAINILHKALTAVGLTVAAYRRLSGYTPDEVGMPNCELGKLSLYS